MGIRVSGEECLLRILWRYSLTKWSEQSTMSIWILRMRAIGLLHCLTLPFGLPSLSHVLKLT